MELRKRTLDAIVMWKYEVNNEEIQDNQIEGQYQSNERQYDNFDDFFHIFDFGLSYDLQYLAIFEEKIRKQNNISGRIKRRQKSDLRIKLYEVKSNRVVFESSLLQRGFLNINFHFSQDSNFLICQGCWDGYLIIDIQQQKEFIFNNVEDTYLICQMDTINSYYLNKDKKIFHINVEQINQKQEKEIYLKFNFNFILYFKSFLQKFALISTELYQYIIYLENCKIIKQRKKQTDFLTQLIIFKNCIIIEQENIHETEYSVRLLHSGKLLRRIKNLYGDSGNISYNEFGVYKNSFLKIENQINHYQIKIFDLLRGNPKEISYRINSQPNDNYEISKLYDQFIFTMIMSGLQTQIICYILR
ncbi:unnamed protein product [Paramecium pentaurelia]|uniref:Uncharacterized protein n=1 Tax=Paramecium pentaurelia TaxID=43138 RepID=A0A8S1WNY6_9CILI|nr:unnamed protein product [Paramecium pentaurelia]